MAVDGWDCKTRQLMRDDVGLKVSNFRNLKCARGIVVMARCDPQRRLNIFSAISARSADDAQAFDAIASVVCLSKVDCPCFTTSLVMEQSS
jgi:hypothetical protein